jgi:hypothetical protein
LSNHCCGCGQRAASLQCAAPRCSRMFHVPCVQGMGASLSQVGTGGDSCSPRCTIVFSSCSRPIKTNQSVKFRDVACARPSQLSCSRVLHHTPAVQCSCARMMSPCIMHRSAYTAKVVVAAQSSTFAWLCSFKQIFSDHFRHTERASITRHFPPGHRTPVATLRMLERITTSFTVAQSPCIQLNVTTAFKVGVIDRDCRRPAALAVCTTDLVPHLLLRMQFASSTSACVYCCRPCVFPLQDGSCWCSEHQHVKLQQPAAGPFAGQNIASTAATDTATAHAGLSSPEPSKAPGLNPSPSFAAALVLQQMRCSKGFDVLLLGPDTQLGEPGADSSSGAGSSINEAAAGASAGRGAAGRTRTSAHRRLLEAMPPSNGTSSTGPWQYSGSTARRGGSQPAGLYGSTAEASRQYHLEQQQQAAYGGPQGPAASAQRPAASMLLQRLQQQSGQTAWQRQQQQEQQQHVGPTRRSPQSSKGRPPLHMPPGKAKGSWNTLGLVSAFALAQQQEEEALQQQEQQQRQQLAASHAAAAAVAVSGPTVVVPRVRAKKGAAMHAAQY